VIGYVCDHILKLFEDDILQTACGNFTKFTPLDAGRDKDEPIRFWGQKVKGQGHDEIKYGQKSLVLNAPFQWTHTGQWLAMADHLVIIYLSYCKNSLCVLYEASLNLVYSILIRDGLVLDFWNQYISPSLALILLQKVALIMDTVFKQPSHNVLHTLIVFGILVLVYFIFKVYFC